MTDQAADGVTDAGQREREPGDRHARPRRPAGPGRTRTGGRTSST